jgi:hypothetical protein
MSEQQTAEATATETEATTEPTEQKPTETVEFWKAKAREQEKRAKENATAATRLAEIEEAQTSESDKAAKRLAEAETRVVEAEARALRREVALEHKLSKDDADLLDALTDEDAMRRFAARLATASEDKRKTNNVSPREGNNPSNSEDEALQTVRGLFGGS